MIRHPVFFFFNKPFFGYLYLSVNNKNAFKTSKTTKMNIPSGFYIRNMVVIKERKEK
jgi:hypothetical protein